MAFTEKVVDVVKKIPKGETLSYKEVAIIAGSPNAARVVGNIMKNNKDSSVPCHRVIKSDGSPGGYNQLQGKSKQQLLNEEKRSAN